MRINYIFKKLCLFLLAALILLGLFVKPKAEIIASDDLIVLRKALLGAIAYDSLWLDTNGDTEFNIKDLIRMKKYLTDNNTEINPLKYVDITLSSGDNQNELRIYTSEFQLPEPEAPYCYWKIDDSYYLGYDTIYVFSDTKAVAVKTKSDIDFPIINF